MSSHRIKPKKQKRNLLARQAAWERIPDKTAKSGKPIFTKPGSFKK